MRGLFRKIRHAAKKNHGTVQSICAAFRIIGRRHGSRRRILIFFSGKCNPKSAGTNRISTLNVKNTAIFRKKRLRNSPYDDIIIHGALFVRICPGGGLRSGRMRSRFPYAQGISVVSCLTHQGAEPSAARRKRAEQSLAFPIRGRWLSA